MKTEMFGKLLSLLLAAALLVSFAPAARAEIFRDADEMDMVHWALAGTFRMLANAADREEEKGSDSLCRVLLGIDVMNPTQAFIIQLTRDQADSLVHTLDCRAASYAPPTIYCAPAAITRAHNSQYNDYYAAVAQELEAAVSCDNGITGFDNVLVVLTYGNHISLTCVDGSRINSCFMISDENISAALTEEDIAAVAAQFGIEGLSILRYTGDSLDTLLSLDKKKHGPGAADILWGDGMPSAREIVADISESEAHMRALFPKIAKQPRMDKEMVLKCLDDYITQHYDLAAARFVAEEMKPLLYQTHALDFMDYLRGITDSDLKRFPAPQIAYIDGGEEGVLRENATYLIVVERLNAKTDPVYGCDMLMESVLPAWAIPAAPEEADYIIRVTVDWDGDKYTQGNLEVYYANVQIGVYDAATGRKVKTLESYTHGFTGYMRVTSTVTYLSPDRLGIWTRIRNLFQ